MKKIGLTMMLLMLVRVALFAQQTAAVGSPDAIVPYRYESDAGASEIIFSNLGAAGDLYNSNPYDALPIAGKDAPGTSEEWFAVAFVPKVDARAKVLLAAIGYTSGAKRIKLGIYRNDPFSHSVGRLINGGEGSTALIPDLGTCCQLARVTLPGDGVTLSHQSEYWLVGSTDDVNAPTFIGGWHLSYTSRYAYFPPPDPWRYPSGGWPAAEIRGTRAQNLSPAERFKSAASKGSDTPTSNVTIFTNLGPTPANLYAAGAGVYVAGDMAFDTAEVWDALPFTVTANSHAKTLAAAIGYDLGTKRVNLGIYSDNAGNVGTLLAGGQGSTTQIPDVGDCCQLTQVTLPGDGVALTPGTYWLVASPDNTNAPTFEGEWQNSNLALDAFRYPENFGNWISVNSGWLAAEIRGTSP